MKRTETDFDGHERTTNTADIDLVRESFETILANHAAEFWLASEMQNKADLHDRRSEVAGELLGHSWMKMFGCLVLDDDSFVDDHVHCLSRKRLATVVDHHGNFAIDLVAFRNEIAFHRQRVYVLAISEAEDAVNVVKRANDRARYRFIEKFSAASFHVRTIIQSVYH
jgi:hypothetical protein